MNDCLVLSLGIILAFIVFGFMAISIYTNSDNKLRCPNCGNWMKPNGPNSMICPNCGKRIENQKVENT